MAHSRGVIVVIPTHLPHISAHVENAEFIGFFSTHRMRSKSQYNRRGRSSGVDLIPRHLIRGIASAETEAPAGWSATDRPFPFHLGRQSIPVGRRIPSDRVERKGSSPEFPASVRKPVDLVNRLQPIHLTFGIAPLHSIIPANVPHRVVVGASISTIGQVIAKRSSKSSNLFPLPPSHLVFPDVKTLDGSAGG